MSIHAYQKHYAKVLFSLNHSINVLDILMDNCQNQDTEESSKIYSTLFAVNEFLRTAQKSADALMAVIPEDEGA